MTINNVSAHMIVWSPLVGFGHHIVNSRIGFSGGAIMTAIDILSYNPIKHFVDYYFDTPSQDQSMVITTAKGITRLFLSTIAQTAVLKALGYNASLKYVACAGLASGCTVLATATLGCIVAVAGCVFLQRKVNAVR